MRTLLITLAVVAFLAAPAMAAIPSVSTVTVNLEVEGYINVEKVPSSVQITVANGVAWGDVNINFQAASNSITIPAITAAVTGSPGNWSTLNLNVADYGGTHDGFYNVDVTVKVDTLGRLTKGIFTGAATVTITLTGSF